MTGRQRKAGNVFAHTAGRDPLVQLLALQLQLRQTSRQSGGGVPSLLHAHVARPKVVNFATAAFGTEDFATVAAMVFSLGVGKEDTFGFGQGGRVGRDAETLGQHHAAMGRVVGDPFHHQRRAIDIDIIPTGIKALSSPNMKYS